MARSRSGQDLINDTYRRADVESDTDRHPRADVLRYVNQGCAELYDLLVEARGKAYYRKATPWTITTTASTSLYTSGYPSDFYRLISVRRSGVDGELLQPLQTQEEAFLRDVSSGSYPSHYELRPNGMALLPEHSAGSSIVVEYIPAFTDLTDSSGSNFDGINGWEEYVVCFAARCIAVKDEEWELAQALERDMARLASRIQKLAPTKDTFRSERVQDVRGGRAARNRWW